MLRTRDIFFAASLLVACAVSLEVQITPSYGEISIGESKFFMCEVVGVAKHIEWFGPSGDRIEPSGADITVTRNDESSSTLTLYKARTENAGTYKCVATNGDQQAESTVKVKIFQKITFTNVPSPQEFTEGDNANIVCDVVSSPPPTVIWKYKRAKIQLDKDVRFKILSNNHLQIRGIKKTDEGSYTCEGRLMPRGEIDLRIIKVVVNVLPTIRVWQSEVNATADVGQPAMLTCAVDGYPEPMVTWTRISTEYESGSSPAGESTALKTAKILMDVTNFEGDYTCMAFMRESRDSHQNLVVLVLVKPRITYMVNLSISETDEQVTLTCEASGDPTPTINWSNGDDVYTEEEQAPLNRIYQASWTRPEQHKSLDGNVVVRSDARVSSLTLKSVKYTDAGQYLCTARSAIGEDSQSAYLEVRYAPKIHGEVAVYTWEGNAVNISCEVRAHPNNVSIVWLRDGLQLPNSNTSNIKVYRTPASSFLQISPQSEDDFGSYNCTASNELGTRSKEFLLIQAEVPSAPFISEVRPFSTSAQIQFEAPESTGGVPVLRYRAEWRTQGHGTWLHQVYNVPDGSLGELTITGLKPESSYEMTLSAVNGKGEGENSPAEFFKTEPVHSHSQKKNVFHYFSEDTAFYSVNARLSFVVSFNCLCVVSSVTLLSSRVVPLTCCCLVVTAATSRSALQKRCRCLDRRQCSGGRAGTGPLCSPPGHPPAVSAKEQTSSGAETQQVEEERPQHTTTSWKRQEKHEPPMNPPAGTLLLLLLYDRQSVPHTEEEEGKEPDMILGFSIGGHNCIPV
ncbi:neural cell adhesion molecule 1 isoform X1 [Solea senegalensis]|uniref:Neural cell adhesion molecule 1 isoform X1 n=1 Tax=Solea senegalensis TaxID=28829 RepID=A0AAV6PZQ0_SOLSE|nr:neural cell adhesion molecule 1 isoform X1 [Solea senegalensis]